MTTITIGGTIGCGKTTVLTRINLLKKFVVRFEPIEKWGSWLDMFYVNPEKHAFPFQMKVLREFSYEKTDGNTITERSPLDSMHIFAKVLVDTNKLTHMEYNLFGECVETFGWNPSVYIYIRTTPEECFDRLRRRNRGCETGVTFEYIQEIHNAYEHFVNEIAPEKYPNMIVKMVNGNQCEEDIYKDVVIHLNNVGVLE